MNTCSYIDFGNKLIKTEWHNRLPDKKSFDFIIGENNYEKGDLLEGVIYYSPQNSFQYMKLEVDKVESNRVFCNILESLGFDPNYEVVDIDSIEKAFTTCRIVDAYMENWRD